MSQFHETDLISPQQNLENMESFPSNGDQALGKTEKTAIPVRGLFSSKSLVLQMFQTVVWMKISVYLEMREILRIISP